jgi:hypothetical protein
MNNIKERINEISMSQLTVIMIHRHDVIPPELDVFARLVRPIDIVRFAGGWRLFLDSVILCRFRGGAAHGLDSMQ